MPGAITMTGHLSDAKTKMLSSSTLNPKNVSPAERASQLAASAVDHMDDKPAMAIRLAALALTYDPKFGKAWFVLAILTPGGKTVMVNGRRMTGEECHAMIPKEDSAGTNTMLREKIAELDAFVPDFVKGAPPQSPARKRR